MMFHCGYFLKSEVCRRSCLQRIGKADRSGTSGAGRRLPRHYGYIHSSAKHLGHFGFEALTDVFVNLCSVSFCRSAD